MLHEPKATGMLKKMLILAVTWTLLVTYHVKSYEEGSGRNTFFTECGKTQTYKKDGISQF